MYDLPEDADLSFLKERELGSICFAPYSLYMYFDADVVITIEGGFQHGDQHNGVIMQSDGFPLHESGLMRLLNHKVMDVEVQNKDTLRLVFSNGDSLTILGGSDSYESYHIKHGDRTITV